MTGCGGGGEGGGGGRGGGRGGRGGGGGVRLGGKYVKKPKICLWNPPEDFNENEQAK